MRRVLCSFLLCSVLMLSGLVGNVQAANFVMSPKVVVLPIVSDMQEIPEGVSSQIMDRIIETFQYPKYNMIADDFVMPVLDKVDYQNVVKTQGLNEGMLKNIMLATNSDMVVAIHIKNIKSGYKTGRETDYATLAVKMDMMTVYSWQNKAFVKKVNEELETEYVTVVRTNWPAKEVSKIVSRYLAQATK